MNEAADFVEQKPLLHHQRFAFRKRNRVSTVQTSERLETERSACRLVGHRWTTGLSKVECTVCMTLQWFQQYMEQVPVEN